MSKLVSMKITKADREPKADSVVSEVEAPEYPWGLQVRLDEKAIEKLGIDLPKVGSEQMLIAKVSVVSVSSSAHNGPAGKSKHRSIELQITDLCLEDAPAEKSDAAAELYKA